MHWREQSSSSNVAQIKMVWVYCCFLPVLRETRNSGFPPGWGVTPFFGLNGYVPPNRLRFSGSWILIRVDNAKCTYPQAAAISPTTPVPAPSSITRLFTSPFVEQKWSVCIYLARTNAASHTTQLSSPTSACWILSVPFLHSISLSNMRLQISPASSAILNFMRYPLTLPPFQCRGILLPRLLPSQVITANSPEGIVPSRRLKIMSFYPQLFLKTSRDVSDQYPTNWENQVLPINTQYTVHAKGLGRVDVVDGT